MPRKTKQKSKINSTYAYKALLLATIALTVNFWAWAMLSPLGGTIETTLGLTPLTLSLLLAAPIIIGSLGRIPIGAWTDRYGGRKMLIVTTLATALPVVGLAFASQVSHYFLAASLLGLGGTLFVVGVPYVNAWFSPGRRGLALGLYSIGDAGTAVAGFTMPGIAEHFAPNIAYLVVAGALVLTAILLVFYAHDSPKWKPSRSSALSGLIRASKQKLTWDMSLVYAVTFGAFVAFGVYLPVLLRTNYDLTLADAAARAGGFIVVATIARPLGGWLSDHIGAKRVTLVSLFATVPLATFVAFQTILGFHTTMAYLTLAVALGAGSGAIFALLGRLVKPSDIGSVSGIVGAIGGLGGFLPPLVLGISYQYFGSYALALLLLAVSALLALAYIVRRFRDHKVYYAIYRRPN